MIRRAAATLGLSLLTLSAGHAQGWDCADPTNLPQQGMNYCASLDFEPLMYHSCRAELTRERTKQINSLLEE